MTRLSSLPLRLTALLGSAVIIASACSPAAPASVAPSSSAAVASQPPVSTAPFEAVSYPEDGSSACGTEGYNGQIGSIKATAANSVEFTLCAPDAAFLSKVAFTSLAIQDSDFLTETGGGGEALFRNPNGTGPYKLKAWTSGSDIALETNADYWGDAPLTPDAVIRWSTEPAQRLVELTSGTVDGIDNPGADDFDDDRGQRRAQAVPAHGAEHHVRRHEQHEEVLGQREGPPGDRHGHRPAADRRHVLPARIVGRHALHAVRHPRWLHR